MYSGLQTQVCIAEPCSLFGDYRSPTQRLPLHWARCPSLARWVQAHYSSGSLPFPPRRIEILFLVQLRAYPWPMLSSFSRFTEASSLLWFPAFTPNTDGDLWFTEEAGLCWVLRKDMVLGLLPPPDAWMLGFHLDQICPATSARLFSLGGARQDSRLFTCNQLLPSRRVTQSARALLHQGHRMFRRGPRRGGDLAGRLICDRSDP